MSEPTSGSPLTAYRLTDQFGRVYERASVADRPALYVIATRQGAGALAEWTRELRALATGSGAEAAASGADVQDVASGHAHQAAHRVPHDPIAVIPVVAIAGVPFFLRGAVCRLLPREAQAWVLVDFDGALASRAAPGAACTVTLVDRAGVVQMREVVGSYRPAQGAALLTAAERAR